MYAPVNFANYHATCCQWRWRWRDLLVDWAYSVQPSSNMLAFIRMQYTSLLTSFVFVYMFSWYLCAPCGRTYVHHTQHPSHQLRHCLPTASLQWQQDQQGKPYVANKWHLCYRNVQNGSATLTFWRMKFWDFQEHIHALDWSKRMTTLTMICHGRGLWQVRFWTIATPYWIPTCKNGNPWPLRSATHIVHTFGSTIGFLDTVLPLTNGNVWLLYMQLGKQYRLHS